MSNRAKAEALIYQLLNDLDTTGYNTKKHKEIYKDMSDKDFHNYMTLIRDGKASLVFFMPHDAKIHPTTEYLNKVGDKYGINFYEKLVITGNKDTPDHTTPIEYMILDLPIKRQSQNLIKKVSIPEHNRSIDYLTYQPTGDSKGARLSYPEIQLLVGLGLSNSVDELIRFRGGDKNGFAAYNAMFMRYGSANIKTLNQYSSGVESTKTVKVFLTSAHIKNTI